MLNDHKIPSSHLAISLNTILSITLKKHKKSLQNTCDQLRELCLTLLCNKETRCLVPSVILDTINFNDYVDFKKIKMIFIQMGYCFDYVYATLPFIHKNLTESQIIMIRDYIYSSYHEQVVAITV